MVLEDLYRLLKSGHVEAQGVVDTITLPVIVLDKNLCVTTANNAFVETFQVEREDVLGQSFFDLGDKQWDVSELRHLMVMVVPKATAVIGFEVAHDFPRIGKRTFLVDARRLLQSDDTSKSILVSFEDVTERRRQDVEQNLILSETRHRVKNLFAMVRAIVSQSKANSEAIAQYRDSLLGRIEAALAAEEIAAGAPAVDFERLLRKATGEAFADRFHYQGPAVQLSSPKVLTVGMLFHELYTNAVKYGALSVPDGRIHVTWTVKGGEGGRNYLSCEWREENGPAVAPPERKGYGTDLIERTAAYLGGSVELDYDSRGLTAAIQIRV